MALARDSSRSFCLSKDKVNLQQLNMRLASYLQQVRCLEAANQKLECQIQEELNRKCPGELRELDRHLRPASLLQDQIGECLSAQAKVRLQLLNAELNSLDLKDRCEKEHEHRSRLEAALNDLRELGEELTVHKLPELRSWLSDHSQQLMELQIQHQQGFLAQVSGGVTVKMQTTGSSDLIQQLNDLRQTSTPLMAKNQSEDWVNTQGSMLSSPVVTFDPAAKSEVDQAELEELRRTAACLEEDLRQLQALNAMLENSGLEQTESFVLQLEVLQQTADRLCGDLDSVLQATAQQAADHETLLDIKTRLEAEINNYKRLLDGQSKQRYGVLLFNFE
ncbi:keratin, type I cytoskeletal 17-like [Notolabrus celidotus]|uniref:keratin, type I cytoskeletal 17-like n=1 Tax=Notolabrus celidotus TaxID=1203425 RepID=UPI0014900BE2|nr:keratin, type I cytoskeletal 17-like [Notolabrus celidotus]